MPFLVELAAEPSIHIRDQILGLIAAIAQGSSYRDRHGGLPSGLSICMRNEPGFDAKLRLELEHVESARSAVWEHESTFSRMLRDDAAMVRAGSACVLSCFPEHKKQVGPLIRDATLRESHPIARGGMLWCMATVEDDSPEGLELLADEVRGSSDPRVIFAAAIAWHRITGQPLDGAVAIYQCMAAAEWYAESFLEGLPWDYAAGVVLEELLVDVCPDATAATSMLMQMLVEPTSRTYSLAAIVHDLLALNFPEGNWRVTKGNMNSMQKQILSAIVATDAVWTDPTRLWFFVHDGAKRIQSLTAADINQVRNEMHNALSSKQAKWPWRIFR